MSEQEQAGAYRGKLGSDIAYPCLILTTATRYLETREQFKFIIITFSG